MEQFEYKFVRIPKQIGYDFMKKIIAVLLSITVVFSLTACDKTTAEKSLYEHGLDLITLMVEMAESEEYCSLYAGSSPEMKEIFTVAGSGDYNQPKAVYQITIAEDVVSARAGLGTEDSLSEALQNYIAARTQNALVLQINANGGAQVLAAASVCTASKTFVSTELTESAIYLYTYKNGFPAIVTFTPGEDNTVAASSYFIFNENFKTDSHEGVEQYFAEISASVSVLER